MSFKVLVLAAGKGTRFKSNLPKVMHKILGKPMLYYVLKTALRSGAEEVGVVIGHGKEIVKIFLKEEFPSVKVFYQEEQLGTGHAVLSASPFFERYKGKLVVLNGDMPLIKEEVIRNLGKSEGDMAVLTVKAENPTGYGRVIREGREVVKIVEEKDATEEEKGIKEVNAGVYSFNPQKLLEALEKIDNNNSQKEYYLPDVLKVFKKEGLKVISVEAEEFATVMGVNNRHELSLAEKFMQKRIVKKLQLEGVTIHNPDSAYIEPDVKIGKDTEIYAPVYIRGKTEIGKNCYVGPFSDIEDSKIGNNVTVESHSYLRGATLEDGTSVGPFAKLRPGTYLEKGAKIGTFVETKKAYLSKNVKANHLSYLGDCFIGENTNVGAGTITCNYDGFNKWKTEIGKDVFVGSNTLFVAPVKVGDGSITAAGSVITSNVPENTLAVARAKQVNLVGKAESIREKKRKVKDEHTKKNS